MIHNFPTCPVVLRVTSCYRKRGLTTKEGRILIDRINECYQTKGLKQKISKDTYLQKGSAEYGGYAGVFTSIWIIEKCCSTPRRRWIARSGIES